jgi:hypothetical protein
LRKTLPVAKKGPRQRIGTINPLDRFLGSWSWEFLRRYLPPTQDKGGLNPVQVPIREVDQKSLSATYSKEFTRLNGASRMCYNSSMLVKDHELLLGQITVENGPYMRATFESLIDTDFTDTSSATAVLGEEFTRYLAVYFPGWRLLQRVEPRSRYPGGPVWKDVHYVLVLGSDADVETVRSHIAKTPYAFDFRCERVRWRG